MSEEPDLRTLFVREAGPHLDRLADGALVLERGDAPPELVGDLFRAAHNLKSSAALVGLQPLSEVAHGLEDLLGDLRAGRRGPDAALVEAILAVTDAIREMIPTLLADEDPSALVAAAHAALAAGASPSAGTAADDIAGPTPETSSAGDDLPPEDEPALAPDDETIAVDRERLDRLVRLGGEAIAAQLRLRHQLTDAIAADPDAEAAALALERTLGRLREEAVASRTTTLAAIATPLRRAVRDIARAAGKEVDYRFEGERVELDRAVLDGIREPLLHLVRNAADHGIEAPDERRRAGKPPIGQVHVHASRRGPEIVIEVVDDGRGLDEDALRAAAGADAEEEAADLAFRPGVSTAPTVTDVSGRGVGLDAVRAAVEALRGRVSVSSQPGAGSTFRLVVPLTLAVLPCLHVAAGDERYAIPAHAAITLVEDPPAAKVALEGRSAMWVGGDVVPLADLAAVVGAPRPSGASGPAVVLDAGAAGRCALRVDEVFARRDVTVVELGGLVPRSGLVSGASIEPDGAVVLVLDATALVERAAAAGRDEAAPAGAPPSDEPAEARRADVTQERLDVLVVDDALTVRELQRSILERAGYEVRVASDGREALARLAERRADVVVTDVEMPGLDGLALTRAIRADAGLASTPVLMVTSKASDEDRRAGLEAGADAYLVKQDFDEARLLEAVARLLGRTP